jgi:glyceraldehyde 3-phosphate dehydrogenase
MEKIKVGINGFGRIGRYFTRLSFQEKFGNKIEIVGINDLGSIESMAHLMEFDSIHRHWDGEIVIGDGFLEINRRAIRISHEKDPAKLNWSELDVDVVLESTGKFKTESLASKHIDAGAKRVIVTAVASGENIKTIVLGANQDLLDGSEKIISNASCTTNCAAPLVDIIHRNFGIDSGYITTVHSYTSDQSLHDRAHADLRRARAAALSMIPTTTGAAKAITKIFPELDGSLGGAGIRVPVPNGSLTDITYIVQKDTSVSEINDLFREASNNGNWKSYLDYTEKPIVSSDIIGNSHSAIFDALLTSVIGKMVKVVAWYDNEAGYSSRLGDLIIYWSKLWGSGSDRP